MNIRSSNAAHARFGQAVVGGAAMILSSASSAQASSPYDIINREAAQAEITVTQLRSGLSMLEGSGGNMVVLAGPEGLLMVDAGIAVSRNKIKAALAKLSGGPIRHLVTTHWHWDHADGNGWAREAGAKIYAHPNTIGHLSQTIRVEEWKHTFTPIAARDRPNIAVRARTQLVLNGETATVRAYKSGHTDGDLSVQFAKADVLAIGDTWWNGHYPFIDYVAGGDIDGVIAQADESIALAGPATLIVPGHGPFGSRTDLIAYRDMLVDIRGRVAKLKAAGQSLEAIIAANPTAAYDAKWGTSLISPALFTTLVYRGI